MTSNTLQFQPAADCIEVDAEDVCRSMGYLEETPAEIRRLVDQLRQESLEHLKIECGCVFRPVEVHKDCFLSDGQTFACGKIIGAGLKQSTSVALCVATLGGRMDAWSRGYFARGDPVAGFVADTIGSVAVDAVANWLAAEIQTRAEANGDAVTNHYSPGYCDWNVAEQQHLFALLPPGFCGVRLTPSSLMVPIKSISGVIGLGPAVRKLDYECNICTVEECIYRNARMRKISGRGSAHETPNSS